ncbi:MAG: bacillithiol biosynthesis cysteine-adding enzyme BshC [candidate division Zixibacteria bacterium]|nr:bacillithiol biosynthesis cysteine-adding enzyme BshC [Candidatus Tariuqbacter arcticus]
MVNIPFTKIPGYTALYNDYLSANPKLSRFYNGHHRNRNDFFRITERVVEQDYNRQRLVDVLRRINSAYGLTPAVEANLELLRHEKTVTVITGQQAGIFTGSIYTILKAITTLKAASYLGRMLKVPVAPLFWMESSDHDLSAVNHIYFPGPQRPIKFTYGKTENPRQRSVGGIEFGKDFNDFSRRIKETFHNNDYYEAVTRLMDETYYPGATFGTAFGSMMSRLFGRWGLIMVNAEDEELKRLAAPIIIRKLEEKGRMNQLLQEQSQELERADYERQIQVRSELLNVFILKDNNRIPLNLLGEVLGNGDEKEMLSDQELVAVASEHPEWFSPKVAFRPIVQDFLFPTVAYIGGPAELAYFAQLKKVYEFFEIQMPIIWPSASAAIVDVKTQRHLQRAGAQPEDVFRNSEEVLREIIEKYTDIVPEDYFDTAERKLEEIVEWLGREMSVIDPSLSKQFNTSHNKMRYQLNSMKKRTFARLKEKNQGIVESWRKVQIQLHPNNRPQERVYNIVYFLANYGFWLMDYLLDNLDIEVDEHQFLVLPS